MERIRNIEIVIEIDTNKRTLREIFTPFPEEDTDEFIERVKENFRDMVRSTI